MTKELSIKKTAELAPVLKQENEYQLAITTGTKMIFKKESDAKITISEAVENAIFVGGWKVKDDTDMILICQGVLQDIKREFAGLTDLQVKHAFSLGARGVYGETMGMSIASAYKWLKAYLSDPNRVEQAQKLLMPLENIIPEVTRIDRMRLAIYAYNKFLEKGVYDDYGNIIYDFLDIEGLITFSTAQKHDFLARAKIDIANELSKVSNLKQHRDNAKIFAEIQNNESPKPIIVAKKIALNEYFYALKLSNFKKIPFKNEPTRQNK